MTLRRVINDIKHNRVPNITDRKQVSDKWIVRTINEALTELYSQFTIEKEQAVIFVPENRNTFELSDKDPNVILGTYDKMNKYNTLKDRPQTKEEFLDFHSLDEEHHSDYYGYNHAHSLAGEDVETHGHLEHNYPHTHQPHHSNGVDNGNLKDFLLYESPSNLGDVNPVKSREVLQPLEVKDDYGTQYEINEKNVFAINQNTLYFPNCKCEDIIYVIYKVKPKVYTLEDCSISEEDSEELYLPDTLMRCFYSYIDLRIISTVGGHKELYANTLQEYQQALEKAMMRSDTLPRGLETTLNLKKGFY